MSIRNESGEGEARDTRPELDRQPSTSGLFRKDDKGVRCCHGGLYWRRKAAGEEGIVAGRVTCQCFRILISERNNAIATRIDISV